MPTLVGLLEPGPELPCRWCGKPAFGRLAPEHGGRLGPVPLHLACGLAFMRAYERMRRGETISDDERRRLSR